MLIPRLRDARGSALVPALLVMSILLLFGVATLQLVEGDQADSRRTRESESAFALAEGLLGAQIFQLSTRWPSKTSVAYPADCTPASTVPDCPNAATLGGSFVGPDYTRGMTWSVQVRDNASGAANFYSDDAAAVAPARDANDDNYVWVRAEARAAGRSRALVALVQAESVPITFPSAAVVAGRFEVSNNGNKVLIDTDGLGGPPGDVIVRCTDVTAASCADWDDDKIGQVSPDTVKSNPAQPDALTPEALELLRTRAQAEGNHYAGCAPSLQGDAPGEVVFMENAEGCQFNANHVYNSETIPGYVVIARGTPKLLGTAAFYGVIYHANLDDSSATLIDMKGNISIFGAVVIDGAGGLSAGSSGYAKDLGNLVYDPNATRGLKAVGTAGLVQNTFREIHPGTATG